MQLRRVFGPLKKSDLSALLAPMALSGRSVPDQLACAHSAFRKTGREHTDATGTENVKIFTPDVHKEGSLKYVRGSLFILPQ